jgi:excisionase family DNA binding protein
MSAKEILLRKLGMQQGAKAERPADVSEEALAAGSGSPVDPSAALRLALSIKNVCKATDLSKSFIYEQIAGGLLPTVKVGGKTLVALDDLKDWLSRHRSVRNNASGLSHDAP